jgi:hypothetical protein
MQNHRIVPYAQVHIPAVKDFNARLRRGGFTAMTFPESPEPSWLLHGDRIRLYCELFLAVDGDGVVRGGYSLKHQLFRVQGKLVEIGFCQYPISESVIDPKYSFIGAMLFRDAMQRQEYMYALGIGGHNEPYAKALRALHWQLHSVPFYFMVVRTAAFLRNVQILRSSSWSRMVCDFPASAIVLAPLIHTAQWVRGLRSRFAPRVASEVVPEFGEWANAMWEEAADTMAFAALRDTAVLNVEYPPDGPCVKLKCTHHGDTVGWVVVLATRMNQHRHFGSLMLGTIVDCMALKGFETSVVDSAIKYLRSLHVDLIVSNQNHETWRKALVSTGFSRGPSNYILGLSSRTAAELEPLKQNLPIAHLTRGDGSGPIHL